MKKIFFWILTIFGYIISGIGFLADLIGIKQELNNYDLSKVTSPIIVFFAIWWPVFLLIALLLTLVWFAVRCFEKREQRKKATYLPTWFNAENRNTKYCDGKNYLLRIRTFLLNKDQPFSWWMISSVAGMGKTRTVLESVRDPRISSANIKWLKTLRDYKEETLTELIENMIASANKRHIIIAEDAQINMNSIGSLISLIDKNLSENDSGHSFRLLLLVRTDERDDSMGRYAQLLSMGDEFVIENSRYKEAEGSYELKIERYPEDKISSIVESYISDTLKSRHQAVWTDTEMDTAKKQVLNVLSSEKMDPNHLRPLFALFIADTLMNKEDPTNWSKEKILEYITEARFRKLVKTELHGLQRDINDNLYEKTESIFCLSIIRHGVPFDELGIITEEIKEDLIDARTGLSNAKQLFAKLQMIDSDNIIKLHVPDILSEYFVYKKLVLETNIKKDESRNRIIWIAGRLEGYMDDVAQFRQKVSQDFGYLFEKDQSDIRNFYRIFLENCTDKQITDILKYFQSDNFMSSLSDRIIIEEITDLYITRKDEKSIHKYVEFLDERFNSSNLDGKRFFTEQLRLLCEKFDSVDILTLYCEMLFNMVRYEDDLEKKREWVSLLGNVCHDYQEDSKIVLTYCDGLFNMAQYEEDIEKKRKWISLLGNVCHNHQNDPDIVFSYCKGLNNLANAEKEIKEKRKWIDKLEMVSKNYQDIPEIALRYCRGLSNLVYYENDIGKMREYVEKLETVSKNHQDNPEIVLTYCSGLTSLSACEAEIVEKRKCINKLEVESKNHSDDPLIVLHYCRGLFNLANAEKEIKEKRKWIDKLKVESENHSSFYEIVLEYCRELYIIRKYDEERYDHYMSELSRLLSNNSFRKYALSQEPYFNTIFMLELNAF